MLKLILCAFCSIVVSPTATATSTYICSSEGKTAGVEPIMISWNVGTVSIMPSEVFYSGPGGSQKLDRSLIDGFWKSDKRIWLMFRKSVSSQDAAVLKAVLKNGSESYLGKISMDGKTYSVKCGERG